MEKRKLYRAMLAGSAALIASIFYSTPATAGICKSPTYGGCPVVSKVTHQSGNNYSATWFNDGSAQTEVFAGGASNMIWGLYLITNYRFSGNYIIGGTHTPLLTVTRYDPPRTDGYGDACNSSEVIDPSGVYCDHQHFADRFIIKYGYSGIQNVAIPAGATNSCIVFGVPGAGGGEFFPVRLGSASVPICGPGGINVVEPEPDPEWCGMNTSALTFDFGDMAPAAVSGSSLTKTAVMDCSKAGVTYNLYLSNVSTSGRSTINLGRGVSAIVSANNQTLQTKRTSTGTTNSLNVTVTLNGTPTSTGAISGLGILAVNYL